MNLDRIATTVATDRTGNARVVLLGSAKRLLVNLARCGVRHMTAIDFGITKAPNIARQDASARDIGTPKVLAIARDVAEVNAEARVRAVLRDFCSLRPGEIRKICGGADLLIAAADSFQATARANQVALELAIPFMAIGMYPEGRGGEVFYRVPGVTSACHHDVARSRYEVLGGPESEVSSQGGTIFDLDFVDAVAGQVALGIITRGADNRFGRLLDQLAGRNLLLIRTDPGLRFGDRDFFAERLGSDPANFSFSTVALRCPADPACPYCSDKQGDTTA